MQSSCSTDTVTPLGTPNLTQMGDGGATRHEMASGGRGPGAPPWYGFNRLLMNSDASSAPNKIAAALERAQSAQTIVAGRATLRSPPAERGAQRHHLRHSSSDS